MTKRVKKVKEIYCESSVESDNSYSLFPMISAPQRSVFDGGGPFPNVHLSRSPVDMVHRLMYGANLAPNNDPYIAGLFNRWLADLASDPWATYLSALNIFINNDEDPPYQWRPKVCLQSPDQYQGLFFFTRPQKKKNANQFGHDGRPKAEFLSHELYEEITTTREQKFDVVITM